MAGFALMLAGRLTGQTFTTLHSFTAISRFPVTAMGTEPIPYTGLILSGDTLYGTTENGGPYGEGTVFRLNVDGTGFTNVHSLHGFSALLLILARIAMELIPKAVWF